MYTRVCWFWVSPDWRRVCAACVVRCARVQGAEASRWVPECDIVRAADFQVHLGGGCPGGDSLALPVNHYQSGVQLSHPWIPPERPVIRRLRYMHMYTADSAVCIYICIRRPLIGPLSEWRPLIGSLSHWRPRIECMYTAGFAVYIHFV